MKNYEISAAVGIEDPNYFSVCFRRKFQKTPKEFRMGAGHAGKAKKISIKSWFRRFGVQISMFYLAAGLMIVMVLSGAIYFFAANLMMDETVLKTRDQLEMSGANISTYIARIKGESNVFAADPMLRQYLSGKEDAPEPDLMGQIMTILSNDAYIKSLVVVSKDGRILLMRKSGYVGL